MKRKYSIGFFIGTICLCVLFALAYRISYSRALEKNETKSIEQNTAVQKELEICYYIKDSEGYVTVYESDQKTVYEYTSILVLDLPEHIQEDLKEGIKVTSLRQVYGFLENYSS